MKTVVIYVIAAALGTFVYVLILFTGLISIFPSLIDKLDAERIGNITGKVILFVVIPIAAVAGLKRQEKKEEERRKKPVKETENLRPLNLSGLRDTLKKINHDTEKRNG